LRKNGCARSGTAVQLVEKSFFDKLTLSICPILIKVMLEGDAC